MTPIGSSGVKEMAFLHSDICNREGNGAVPECSSRWASPPASGHFRNRPQCLDGRHLIADIEHRVAGPAGLIMRDRPYGLWCRSDNQDHERAQEDRGANRRP